MYLNIKLNSSVSGSGTSVLETVVSMVEVLLNSALNVISYMILKF